MKTTLREIYKYRPCKEGFARLIYTITNNECFNSKKITTETKHYFKLNIVQQFHHLTEEQKDQEITFLQILASNGVKDTFWGFRTQNYLDYCLILADIVESVLPLYEKRNPQDKRIKECIQAIRDYKNGKITKKKLKHFKNAAYVAAAYVAAGEKQWGKNEEILRKHLAGNK